MSIEERAAALVREITTLVTVLSADGESPDQFVRTHPLVDELRDAPAPCTVVRAEVEALRLRNLFRPGV